jgi:hypothetical protein
MYYPGWQKGLRRVGEKDACVAHGFERPARRAVNSASYFGDLLTRVRQFCERLGMQ